MMRPLREEEVAVLIRLLEMLPIDDRPHFDQELLAIDMADGGMGSIRLVLKSDQHSKLGRELITGEYIDDDSIPVLISINLDQSGNLFELDFWKVNFKPLKRYPTSQEVHSAPPPATIGPRPTIV